MNSNTYTIGDLAALANVSTKAIRIYEQKGLLRSKRDQFNNYRYFDESAKLQLQRIQMLRYLGFSLDAISRTLMHYNEIDLEKSFLEQKKLMEEKVFELERMIYCIGRAATECKQADFNIDTLFDSINQIIINRKADEGAWVLAKHSNEPEGWSKWIFNQAALKEGNKIMDAGNGWGNLWRYNMDRLPKDISVCCVDKHNTHADTFCEFVKDTPAFSFVWDDLETMTFEEKYDCIFFNHVIAFIKEPLPLYEKFRKALNKDGQFICTWGGSLLFQEPARILQGFNPSKASKIQKQLQDILNIHNTREAQLNTVFSSVERRVYEVPLHYESSRELADYLKPFGEKLGFDFTDCMDEFCEYLDGLYAGKSIDLVRDSYLYICR